MENGEKGFLLACLVGSEMVGLLLSPIIFSLDVAQSVISAQILILNESFESGLNSILLHSPNSTVSTLYFYLNDTYTVSQTEGTTINNILRFSDPFRYSGIMTVIDFSLCRL